MYARMPCRRRGRRRRRRRWDSIGPLLPYIYALGVSVVLPTWRIHVDGIRPADIWILSLCSQRKEREIERDVRFFDEKAVDSYLLKYCLKFHSVAIRDF